VLAWLLAQGENVIPIPGTTKVGNLRENVGALGVELTREEVEEVRRVSEAADVHGDRYDSYMMPGCFADSI
jgi:aryl-alcohol dehydrogenase-like predicted oxidoreductase